VTSEHGFPVTVSESGASSGTAATRSRTRTSPAISPLEHTRVIPNRTWFLNRSEHEPATVPAFHKDEVPPAFMDRLTAFGLLAVTAMLVTYAYEKRSRWFVLAFAGACVLGSVYGFLQGAWPFGIIEAIWACVAFRRWYTGR
jgi:hypothetical protein